MSETRVVEAPADSKGLAKEITRLLQAGFDAWIKAGKLLIERRRTNPNLFSEIQAANKLLTNDILNTFVRMGERTLHPRLALDVSPGAQRLSRLPYADQARLVGGKLAVITVQNGTPCEREIDISSLSAKEAELAISPTGIRTLPEQRKFLREQRQRRGDRVNVGRVGGRAGLSMLDDGCNGKEPGEDDGDARGDDEAVPEYVTPREISSDTLESDPRARLLMRANRLEAELLEARSDLALLTRREHPLDRHIATSLTHIGSLRLAVKELVV